MEQNLVKQLVSMIENLAVDTGWKTRKDGSHTRLLKFSTPVTRELRGHLVLAFLHGDAPKGIKVLPGGHTDDLSGDGFLLRLRVLPGKRTAVSVTYASGLVNNNIFGLHTASGSIS